MDTSQFSSTLQHKPTLQRWLALVFGIAIIGVLWLVVFPLIASLPSVARHIETQQRLGIDPSAKFYTELEIAPAIAHEAERRQSLHGRAFWASAAPAD